MADMTQQSKETELKLEDDELYRRLHGMDLSPYERADWFFQSYVNGTMIGDNNRRGLVMALARHFQDQENRLAQLLKDKEELVEALKDARWTISTITPMKPEKTMKLCVDRVADWDALLARLAPSPEQPCGICNGRGEVAGGMPDGRYQPEPCPSCHPSPEQQE